MSMADASSGAALFADVDAATMPFTKDDIPGPLIFRHAENLRRIFRRCAKFTIANS